MVTSSSSLRSFLLARTASASLPESRVACHVIGACGVDLLRHQQPLVGLGQARRHRAVGGLLLRLGLPHLVRVEVERLLLRQDRLPRQVPAHRLVEVLQARLVRREEDERVAVEARRVAARLEDRLRRRLGRAAGLLGVRMLGRQHDQPRVEIVGHVGARARQRMDAGEVAGLPQVGAQPLVQLLRHLVGIALELLGAVLGELGDGRLGGVPVARPVLVEVGGRRREPPQRIAEHGRRLARHHAAELDAAILEPAVRRGRRRRRAEVDGARHAPRRVQLAEVRLLGVDPERQRVRPVHVLLDDRRPVVREVARQLELHARVVDRDGRRQDQRVAVALLPQAVDHRRHQAQHAARALELHQRRPVGVEPVEDLRMDRVGRLDALLVVAVAALGRELRLLRAIEIGEGARGHVALLELRRARRAARTAAGARSRSPPRRSPAATTIPPARPRCAAGRAPRARGCRPPPRRRPACAASPACPRPAARSPAGSCFASLRRLGQRLGEGELGLEAAGRQVALVVELARVGDPLVDQDQARPVLVEQLAQHVAGARRLLVVGLRRARRPSCRRAARPARPTACAPPCRRAW